VPLERRTFWIRWDQADYPVGVTQDDYDLPLGRNIRLEGIGGGREDTTLLFRFYFVFTNGRVERILPRESATAAEDYVTLPTIAEYRASFREIPISAFEFCDVAALRVYILNSGAGVKQAEGHFRGVYYG